MLLIAAAVLAVPADAATDQAGTFVPLSPTRLLDTRQAGGPVGAGQSVRLQVTGRAGVPQGGVGAVTLNVTVTDATAGGYVTAYPDGQPRPLASNLNYVAGQTVANLVVVPVGQDGAVDLYDFGANVQLVVDITGYHRAGNPSAPGAFGALAPQRILDTRSANAVSAGGTIHLQVAGNAGIPAQAAAVVMNLTVTEPTAPGYVTAYPTGRARPLASNVNYVRGQTVPNLVTVPIGAGGQVDLYNFELGGGTVHLVADVAGYYLPGAATATGAFGAVPPSRILDTRDATGAVRQPVAGTLRVQVTGVNGVPATGVGAVVLNVTVTGPTAGGYVTAYPDGTARPTASNLNFDAGQTVANAVVVPVGADGAITLYNFAGRSDLVADVTGYFLGDRGAAPPPKFDHIVVAVMENHSASDIYGNTAAPFINGLDARFTQSYAVAHPSEPNYLALFSGDTQGLTDDSCPHTYDSANLAAAVGGFTGYSEDLPYAGYQGCTYRAYARKHAPWVNFAGVQSRPFTDFPSDFSTLPAVSEVIPNLNDDMHDGTVGAGDTWLRAHLSGYLAWARTHNSLLVVTWDEDDGGTNRIPTLLAGAHVLPGQYPERIDHYRVLRTIEASLGVPPTGRAADAMSVTDVFG